MDLRLMSDFEAFGGIVKEGIAEYVFTSNSVETGWKEYPHAVNARICRNSYSSGNKMLNCGERCIVLFKDDGQALTLPARDWTENIENPMELAGIVARLKKAPELEA